MRLRVGWGGVGRVQRSSQSKPCAPTPSLLFNGVVNEKGQLRCLRSLGPNLGDNTRLLLPSPRSTGQPVPTLANSPSVTPRAISATAAIAAAAAAEILYAGLPTSCKQLTPRLLPAGSTRRVRNFGLVLCLGSSHLSMNIGSRLAKVPTRSFPLPLPERLTHSGFTHTTHIPAGSLPGEYRAHSGSPCLWRRSPSHDHLATWPPSGPHVSSTELSESWYMEIESGDGSGAVSSCTATSHPNNPAS